MSAQVSSENRPGGGWICFQIDQQKAEHAQVTWVQKRGSYCFIWGQTQAELRFTREEAFVNFLEEEKALFLIFCDDGTGFAIRPSGDCQNLTWRAMPCQIPYVVN